MRPAGLALAIVLALAAGGCRARLASPQLQDYGPFHDFALTAHTGERFDTSTLRGTPVLLFFGYTSCPDVCPTTLSRLGEATRMAAADGHTVTPLFVSVDPTVDTPSRLAEVLAFFDFPGIGLTGAAEEVDAVRRAAGIFASRSPADTPSGYLVDHTVSILLIDAAGRLRHLFAAGDPPRVMADAVAQLAAES